MFDDLKKQVDEARLKFQIKAFKKGSKFEDYAEELREFNRLDIQWTRLIIAALDKEKIEKRKEALAAFESLNEDIKEKLRPILLI